MANIATYMMFDDHDVTDDWFLNGRCTTGSRDLRDANPRPAVAG